MVIPVAEVTLIVVTMSSVISDDKVVKDEEAAGVPPNDLSTYISPANPSGSIEPVS